MQNRNKSYTTSRRDLMKASIAMGGAALLGPMIPYGQSANETLNLAAVGVGGKGASDLSGSAAGQNVHVVGLCDVDSNNLGRAGERYVLRTSHRQRIGRQVRRCVELGRETHS